MEAGLVSVSDRKTRRFWEWELEGRVERQDREGLLKYPLMYASGLLV